MVTKASPAPPAAVSSMRLARPVRPAPEAPVMRCTILLVRRAAPAPARPPDWVAEDTALAACLAAVQAPSNPMVQVYGFRPFHKGSLTWGNGTGRHARWLTDNP